MTYLLRLVACLILCVSLNTFGATVRVQASGIITNVYNSSIDSIQTGDLWSSNILFHNVDYDVRPSKPSALFYPSLVNGEFLISDLSLDTKREYGQTFFANPTSGLDEIVLNWGVDNYESIDNMQLGGYSMRLDGGNNYSSLSGLPWSGDINFIVDNFEFNLPNYSFVSIDLWGGDIEGSITSFSLTVVPLPAGIYLFLSGLVGLGLMRGRNV